MLTDVLESEKLTGLELLYTCINFILMTGQSLYDRDFHGFDVVRLDYMKRRTLGGAVILSADALSKIAHQFSEDVITPPSEDGWDSAAPQIIKEMAGGKAAIEYIRSQEAQIKPKRKR